jgi:hypothetical protein
MDVKKIIEKSLSYMFWRTAMLLGIIAFCYGLGTSLPREMRSIFKEMYKNDENTNNQGYTGSNSNDKSNTSDKVQYVK